MKTKRLVGSCGMIEIWSLTEPVVPRVYLNDLIPPTGLVVLLQFLAAMLAIALAIREYRGRARRWELPALAFLMQSFQYCYYCAYVDEVYVNLEHAWNLYHFGRFSFSPGHLVDGTVEILYYLLLAPFAWSHAALVRACMVLGLIITLLHTGLCWYFVRNMPRLVQVLVLLGFAWNPIFAEIQSAGFGNGLVSLLYFGGLVSIWESRWKTASILTCILPLIRPDALLYNGLLIIAMGIKRRRIPIWAVMGTCISTILFLIAVKIYYGHWILTPVAFKKAPVFEVVRGFRRQLSPLVYGLFDHYTLAVFMILIISALGFMKQYKPEVSAENRLMLRVQLVLILIIYQFYVLTNRYFFAETRRYYLPMEWLGLLMIASEWALTDLKSLILNPMKLKVTDHAHDPEFQFPQRMLISMILIGLVGWCYESGLDRWKNRPFRLYDRTSPGMVWMIEREDDFSLIAKLSEDIIPPNWRIATSELQGYGFMLDREIDPLYGYANRRMAMSKTLSKYGVKTDPAYLDDSKPEIIWTGRHHEIEFPREFEPENQMEPIKGFQLMFGFQLDKLVTDYPTIFMLQGESDRGHKIFTSFLVRKGLEDQFRDSLRTRQFEKKYDTLIATDAFREWSAKNPF